jgi:hypothetical protein
MGGSEQDGYATPAAAVISMAVAAMAIAFISVTSMQARLVRADWARSQIEYRLDGAQNMATLSIATSLRAPPYRWKQSALTHDFIITAEPEAPKLGLDAADGLDDALLARLGISDPASVRAALTAMKARAGLAWPADAASATIWRACAGALLSTYGRSVSTPGLAYVEPEAGNNESKWRAGEIWRVSITDTDGWRDERIIRFTGNGLSPAVVIGRRFTRGRKDPLACDTLIAGA